MTVLDVTPEVLRRIAHAKNASLILWGVHHGYWVGADGSDMLTLMPPRSRWTRVVNWLRFKGLVPWKEIPR